MREVGAFEAKTHLGELLMEVGHGASYLITRRGKPVAQLVPVGKSKTRPEPDLFAAVEALKAKIAEHYDVETEMTLREMIEEGRR